MRCLLLVLAIAASGCSSRVRPPAPDPLADAEAQPAIAAAAVGWHDGRPSGPAARPVSAEPALRHVPGLRAESLAERRRSLHALAEVLTRRGYWARGLTESDRHALASAAPEVARSLESPHPGDRETGLRALHALAQHAGPLPCEGVRSAVIAYGQRLLERRGLSSFEERNRGIQLVYALPLLESCPPTAGSRLFLDTLLRDRGLAEDAANRKRMGWAAAAGAREQAQALQARWAAGGPRDA